MKILAICRGAPGLGRVVPSLGLAQTLAATCDADTTFATYAAGYRYLVSLGCDVTDLGQPDGLFIDSVAPQARTVVDLAADLDPDLILIDGEFFLPVALAHLNIPIIYVANPHDLMGPPNTFRRVNQRLLEHCQAVIISSVGKSHPAPLPDLVRDVPCLEVPAIIKDFPTWQPRSAGSLRALVSLGGGSIGADPAFRHSTDQALSAVIDVVGQLVSSAVIGSATVVLGADAARPTARPEWLTLIDHPVELTAMYSDHDLFIARAGRNATAEALYCGIPTVLIPITSDQHRGSEQASNANHAQSSHMTAVPDWRQPGALVTAVTNAASLTAGHTKVVGIRGNELAASFLADLLAKADDLHATLPV